LQGILLIEVVNCIREKKGSLATLQHIWEALGKVERMLGSEGNSGTQVTRRMINTYPQASILSD
jgi:hypothetical protein